MTQKVCKGTISFLLTTYRDLGDTIYSISEGWVDDYKVTGKEQDVINRLEVTRLLTLHSLHSILTGELYSSDVFKELVDKSLIASKEKIDFDSFLNQLELYLITYAPIEIVDC